MLAFSMALPFLPLYIQRLGVPDPEAAATWAGVMTSGSGLVLAAMVKPAQVLATSAPAQPAAAATAIGA